MKVITGEGMPSVRHHEPGDLFVKLHVTFPEHIDPAIIPALERALPPRTPLPTFGRHAVIEEVSLSDLDARQQREANAASDDRMDEDGEGGEPRVACAQQ